MNFRKKLIRNWLAISILAASLIIGALSLVRSIGTLGQPFAGFFFGPNLMVSVGQRAVWPGMKAGLHPLDQIVAVDGNHLRNGDELMDLVRARGEGANIHYQIVRKGESRQFAVPVTHYSLSDLLVAFLAPFLMGLLFISFGSILYFAQVEAQGRLLYFILCAVIGTFLMCLYEAYACFAFFRISQTYPIIGALSAHLIGKITQAWPRRPRARWVILLLYALASVLVIWRQIAVFDVNVSAILSKLSSIYVLLVLAVDILLLVRAYQRAATQAMKDRVKVIVIGFVIATAAIAGWSLNFLWVAKSFYLDEGILLASIFPLFMSYAVLRRNIFDLDRVIRLSLSYGVAAAIVFVVYLGVLGSVQEQVPSIFSGRFGGWVLVVLAALGAVLFNRLRQRVNSWVHRGLFRNQFDLSEALSQLDQSLKARMTASELAEQIGKGLTSLLGLERAAVLCPPKPTAHEPLVRFFRWADSPDISRWLSLFETEGFMRQWMKHPNPIELNDLAKSHPELFPQSLALLRGHEIEVLVPVHFGDRLHAVILLGKKSSHERYDSVDLNLLKPLAHRAGLSFENAELMAESERQTRLAALGQMSGIMIHDIKNPLSTIKIAAGTIKRRFREGDHSYELATFIEEEVDRMNRVVQEILSVAKPSPLFLARCSVQDLLSDLVERLRPSFDAAGISLEYVLPEEEVYIEADAPRLRRAVENVLVNAKEASEKASKVVLRAFMEGKDNGEPIVVVSVEDQGKGMDSTIRERVFQPFFTTKSSGSGLGLAIVKQIVEEHQGEVALESKVGVGTRISMRLRALGEIS